VGSCAALIIVFCPIVACILIREVKPVDVVSIIWVAWGKGEAPIAAFVDYVFHYRATFCEREGSVGYYGGGGKGRQRFE